jgi:hypothetical protein
MFHIKSGLRHYTNNPSRQYFRERFFDSGHDTKHFALDFVRFFLWFSILP